MKPFPHSNAIAPFEIQRWTSIELAHLCPRPSNPFWCPISNVDYLRLIVLPLRHDVVCTSVVANLPCWYSSNKDDIEYVRTMSSAIRS
eukprot:scaffold13353_cov310-Alexandrium_tamarense.AAC.3